MKEEEKGRKRSRLKEIEREEGGKEEAGAQQRNNKVFSSVPLLPPDSFMSIRLTNYMKNSDMSE